MRYSAPTILMIVSLVAAFVAQSRDVRADSSQTRRAAIRLSEIREQGTFNIGAARAALGRSSAPDAGPEVQQLDYTLPQGTAAGVWTKAPKDAPDAAAADVARILVELRQTEPGMQVAAALEIKGTRGVQRIPLELEPGWNWLQRGLDWPAIGDLTEIVVSVSRIGEGAPAVGSLSFDVSLGNRPLVEKLSMLPAVRMIAVLVLSLFAAALVASPRRLLAGLPDYRRMVGLAGATRRATSHPAWLLSLKRDFVIAVSVVVMVGMTLGIYSLGTTNDAQAAWGVLAIAVLGAWLGQWMKYGLGAGHLTAAEVLQDMLASGLLAASASPLAVLQAPAGWSDMLLLSSTVAAVASLVYHAANLASLARSGRHLGPVAGTLVVGTPYVVGSLVMLESGSLVQQLGSILVAGTLSAWPAVPQTLGCLVVVLALNEAVANAAAMATGRSLIRSPGAHAWLLGAAAAVVVAPWIADFGSSPLVAGWPALARLLATLVTTILSQAGLWAEVYLITGIVLDGLAGKAPTAESASGQLVQGMKKGMIYSGVFMGVLYGFDLLARAPMVAQSFAAQPLLVGMVLGALAFPLAKTIIETFDGSQGFFRRVGKSYRDPTLYLRGAVVGLAVGYAFSHVLSQQPTWGRVEFGLACGVVASAGVSFVRDVVQSLRHRGKVQSGRVYLVHGLLGGLIGAGVGFYLDAAQVSLIAAKFHRYLGAGQTPEASSVYPLLSKWGFIRLAPVTGGVNLLWNEALMGVISWSIPAWLFALNRTFMTAWFRREAAPIAALATREGFRQLIENMIQVFRWGLWMSPIIASFLRPMGDPTWYNQDGAIRTAVAIVHHASSSPDAFRAWSLGVFVSLLAYDWVRILIWLDHMGLRVATLVNLSFLGMDKLDQRLARFLGPAATAQCIPESVKRFATWAPLLIPFYIPMGADWNRAWTQAETLQAAAGPGWLAALAKLPWEQLLLVAAVAAVTLTAILATVRWLAGRAASRRSRTWTLSNGQYEVILGERGDMTSRVPVADYDVSRRSYDLLDPAGRALFLVDVEQEGAGSARSWSILGSAPRGRSELPQIERRGDVLRITSTRHGIKAVIEVALAGDDPAELWTITLENLGHEPRRLKLVPYLEWVLNRPGSDRGHTQYNRLFPEMQYVDELHAILAWHKQSKALGVLAVDRGPEGFLTSRIDFVGRAESIASPRALETLAFTPSISTGAHPTFDPIGSLLVAVDLKAMGSAQVRLLVGATDDREEAIGLVVRHLEIPGAELASARQVRETSHPVRHGEILPGTPQPYTEYLEDGRKLLVRTPFTPRPFDHAMSNSLGHVVTLTNRGLHTTSNGNSQQNRLTPDWPDIVTREVPGEAFYLYDVNEGEWFSPTYHPINDAEASHEVEFGVDGTATYHMAKGTLSSELTVFVPPDEPLGVYLLSVRNRGDVTREIRLTPYFQMVLADQPEHAGPLKVRHDRCTGALYFENPRSSFRTGPAFVAMSGRVECVETRRGRFFGTRQDVSRPQFVQQGGPDAIATEDRRPVAALLTTLEIPPGEERTVVVVLGQADSRRQAETLVRKYRDPQAALVSLAATRKWWLELMDTVQVHTEDWELDHYLPWLKYQTLAERIWARRGFYQASGAFGFRDQLQDSVNLMWVDPVLARRQILLHAAQQFVEGDVVHWFHRLQDGRTGFAARTYASDNLLWLVWAVVEYLEATGDESLLDQRVPYLEAEQLLAPLPAGKHGLGFTPLRSSHTESVYRHCMRAIDLVLEHRMGEHGLPLIGTGDWNDGLDEIGSEGKGESVWLGFFLHYILRRMALITQRQEGHARGEYYQVRLCQLEHALESTWREDRYLRAIHDDGTEIGVRGSGVWEIDALTAAWAVMAGIDPDRGRTVFDTALAVLEKDNVVLLGWPALREDTKPYLGRSSWYPEGVRENGMYCHGVQWLVGAARILAERCRQEGQFEAAKHYARAAYRLWRKISPLTHVVPGEIEIYGGQPNKQAADLVTVLDPGRMGWHGYTGAAGWMLRQALEGVLGLQLKQNRVITPADPETCGPLGAGRVCRDVTRSPLGEGAAVEPADRPWSAGTTETPVEWKLQGVQVETRT